MALLPMIDQPLRTDGPQAEERISGTPAAPGGRNRHEKTDNEPGEYKKHDHGIARYAVATAAARSNCSAPIFFSEHD
jgi:hypothetical protein